MKRKVLVILFFVVVFGLPVAWYLFLQAFGENRFDLPKIEEWDQSCIAVHHAAVIYDPSLFTEWPNELRRIKNKLATQDLIHLREYPSDECGEAFDFYLVDEEGWVRGQFVISMEEVDRLMAEIDIYLLNKQNESGTKLR